MPNAPSSTDTIGTRQLVVHEALDTMRWRSGSKRWSLTPITKVASAPLLGAETTTRSAPASKCAARLLCTREPARRLDRHLDAELGPREALRVGLVEDEDLPAPDHQLVPTALDAGKGSVDGVACQQAGQLIGAGQVVDGDEVDREVPIDEGAHQRASRPAEPVQTNPYRHGAFPVRLDQRAYGEGEVVPPARGEGPVGTLDPVSSAAAAGKVVP